MRMDSRMILAGQQPDLVGTAARGFEAGRRNALADTYREHGPGILAGDQVAMNALAQHNPVEAQALTRGQQDMAFDREKMEIVRARAKREAAAYAARLSASEAAAAQQNLAGILDAGKHFLKTGDRDGYNRFAAQNGIDPVEFPFEDLTVNLAKMVGYSEAISGLEGPKPDYVTIDGQIVNRNAEGGPAVVPVEGLRESGPDWRNATPEEQAQGILQVNTRTGQNKYASGMKLTSDGQGGFTLSQGSGVNGANGPPKMPVDAAKNSGFLIRMKDANEVLSQLESQGTDFKQQNLEHVPLGIGNYFRTPEFQKYDQARRDFVNAVLRRESGAVIADSEFENANKQYFPVPGDSPEVIEQKRRNRKNAIAGVRVGSGEGGAYVDSLREQESGNTAAPDVSAMSDEELDAILEAGPGQ